MFDLVGAHQRHFFFDCLVDDQRAFFVRGLDLKRQGLGLAQTGLRINVGQLHRAQVQVAGVLVVQSQLDQESALLAAKEGAQIGQFGQGFVVDGEIARLADDLLVDVKAQLDILGGGGLQRADLLVEDPRHLRWALDEVVVALAIGGDGGQEILVVVGTQTHGGNANALFAPLAGKARYVLFDDDAAVGQAIGEQDYAIDAALKQVRAHLAAAHVDATRDVGSIGRLQAVDQAAQARDVRCIRTRQQEDLAGKGDQGDAIILVQARNKVLGGPLGIGQLARFFHRARLVQNQGDVQGYVVLVGICFGLVGLQANEGVDVLPALAGLDHRAVEIEAHGQRGGCGGLGQAEAQESHGGCTERTTAQVARGEGSEIGDEASHEGTFLRGLFTSLVRVSV